MYYTFTPFTQADRASIQTWHYEEPYNVYNLSSNPEDDLSEMLDRRSPYFAVRDEQETLVGFFCFGTSAQPWGNDEPCLYNNEGVLDLGLGMHPDMTGRGLGYSFVNAGLEFAKTQFAPKEFRLYVLTFNKRAIHVYERVGFKRVRVFPQQNGHQRREFLEMRRHA
jgi:RimJ/RimL family protein N-acetyltransferase